jgi:hypothetical protein
VRRFLLLAIPLALLLLPLAARADSVTIESVFSQQAARQLAIGKVPPGGVVTNVTCLDIDVHGQDRYRCTVEYTPAAAGTSPAAQ